MVLAALIVKERLRKSDRETVEQIRENPAGSVLTRPETLVRAVRYLQYFIGKSTYSNEALFDASLFVHFRTRIIVDLVKK